MKVGDLYPGRVFRETTGLRHMYVLLAVNPIECLMGNWSSYEDGKDATCLLLPADHPAIHHPSVIMYNYAKPISVSYLRKLIQDEVFKPVQDVNQDVLTRILEGFFTSPATRKHLKKRYAHIRPQNKPQHAGPGDLPTA